MTGKETRTETIARVRPKSRRHTYRENLFGQTKISLEFLTSGMPGSSRTRASLPIDFQSHKYRKNNYTF